MKIYISVDIEGITGVTSWNETELDNSEHKKAKEQMTKETLAVCEAAIEMGAEEIYVKDAHLSARNMDLDRFPKEVKLIRGWTGEPVSMLAGLDDSFDGVIFIGYHSAAGEEGNPLAHTINYSMIHEMRINGEIASELMLNMWTAMERGVPSIFISGDKMICKSARELNPNIRTVAVKEGIGGATINLSQDLSIELIKKGVSEALKNIDDCRVKVPNEFNVEMEYFDHIKANKARYYPGVERISANLVAFKASNMEELMTTRMFIM